MYQLDRIERKQGIVGLFPMQDRLAKWLKEGYLPNNFLGILRLRLYLLKLSIVESYRIIRNEYSHRIDEISDLQDAVRNSIKWYYRNRPKDRFREQYDPVLLQQALREYQHLADVLTLFKEVFRGGRDTPLPTRNPFHSRHVERGVVRTRHGRTPTRMESQDLPALRRTAR